MDSAMDALKKEFAGLRTGRASVNLLDPVQVEAYGQRMPLNQVGTVSVPEPRLLTVRSGTRAWSRRPTRRSATPGLGLNPQPEGQLIRIPIPELNEERRKELAKLAHKYAEQAPRRGAQRPPRRHGRCSRRPRRTARSRRTSIARSPTRCRS